ncbi:MAG: DEAD/DEAH box helicase [Myxococcota bacterium]
MPLEAFDPAVRQWFGESFSGPTAVQSEGWGPIAAGRSALLLAPTGSGKTLAAFLAALDRLVRLPPDAPPGVRVLYVSPLKALVYDIERNLRAPLVGIANAASRQGRTVRAVRVDVRTGDTTARERRVQARDPADILVTTPESLYLVLGSAAREALRSVETVIVDEIHVMAAAKRGVHLAVSLERLSALCERDPQRIGLSATQRPLEEIARFLGGDRPVDIVDASGRPRLDLRVVVPVDDMEHPTVSAADAVEGGGGEGPFQRVGGAQPVPEDSTGPDRLTAGMWPAIYPRLLELIRARRSTILFANSRLLCERLARRLNELAGEDLVLAHHGSLSHQRRAEIEDALKAGRLPALVATSSLELGIDMGAVDQVVLVESPGSVSSGLQRVGRSGHAVGETSIGRIFPKFRGDLVEAAVVAGEMLDGRVESTRVPTNCLDVLSQQVVAMVADRDWRVDELAAVVRRSWPYRELTDAAMASVLDMLSGRYPSDGFADLAPRIVWDRATDTLSARRGTRAIALLNGGTIPDRGLYGVFVGADGPRLGELDEEMVYECRRGDLIVLGASTWRIEEITRDRVQVSPAPGEPGRLPFWHGERPGRPFELGEKVGRLLRDTAARGPDAARWLQEALPIDERAAKNLAAYVDDQREAAGEVPTDRTIVVEAFRDELGDWRVCILTPFGARVHAPWGLALEARFAAGGPLVEGPGYDVQVLWTDDGVSLRFADTDELPPVASLFPDPDEVREQIVDQLGRSALFAARFRENAARSLLMPKRSVKGRVPLWAQRLRAQNLLQVASKFPSFPAILETYRECLQEVFDLPSLEELLRRVRSRQVRVHEVETAQASPFARSLVYAYVAAYMYAGDAPLAERKAAALTLDRALLRELLGQEELRDLLEPAALSDVEAELQHLVPERQARSADAVHDLVRRLGELSREEIAARCTEDPTAWLRELELARRVVPVRIAGHERTIAVEDAGRYRDALGVALPPGLPAVFLESVPDALVTLVGRWARTHGPFVAEALVSRWGIPPGALQAALTQLERDERLVLGEIRPGGTSLEWCDPEVLRRLKRRSLALLRDQIAPVEAEVYARFLAGWHGLGTGRGGLPRLREVVEQLEGLPILASTLERTVLPGRVASFSPDLLDTLGAMGEVVWIGCGAAGPRDGKVALFRRDKVPLLLDPPEPDPALLEDPVRRAVWEHLQARGASFLVALQQVADAPVDTVTAALWDLVWAGLVTNDTFQPLRSLQRRTAKGRAGRSGPRGIAVAGGRWSTVADLFAGASEISATERAAARASGLLERYGVATAAGARSEGLPGGFSAVYPVLRAMEESGRVRRGWFVDGLEGAQFAAPGVVDRLRACRVDLDPEEVTVVDAADPANPWGAVLPWPGRDEGRRAARPRGGGGVGGGAAGAVRRQGRALWATFGGRRPELLLRAVQGWLASKPDRWKTVRVERIDGVTALESAARPVLVEGRVRSGARRAGARAPRLRRQAPSCSKGGEPGDDVVGALRVEACPPG